jgi:hypothetical protein
MRRIIEWFRSRLRLSDWRIWRDGAERGAVPSDWFVRAGIGLLRGDLTRVSDDFHAFGWGGGRWFGGVDCCVLWGRGGFSGSDEFNFVRIVSQICQDYQF